MGLALRLNFVDVVCDDSLKNFWANGKKIGYQFDVRLSYYRGHFLSTIDEIGVKVDGVDVPAENISLCLDGKEYGVAELHDLVNVFWPIIEPATIKVFQPGGLSEGEHDVDFTLYFRSPYMALSETEYQSIDSCGSKRLNVQN
jgi:hypothetical protein